MVGEHLGQCKDAAARVESRGTRTVGERNIEPVEMGDHERNIASPQGFERRIQFGPQIHPATNAPKLDDLRPHGHCRQHFRPLPKAGAQHAWGVSAIGAGVPPEFAFTITL